MQLTILRCFYYYIVTQAIIRYSILFLKVVKKFFTVKLLFALVNLTHKICLCVILKYICSSYYFPYFFKDLF